MSHIMDGKLVSSKLRQTIKHETDMVIKKTGKKPNLTVVIVGENPASLSYVRSKKKMATAVGFESEIIELAEDSSQKDVLNLIYQLNKNDQVHGILVQLPLPNHINEQEIINSIAIEKDVDGFHPHQVGSLSIGLPSMEPCTPAGIMAMLSHYDINIEGMHAVVIGRSNIVGKPIASLLLKANATVTVAHSKTKNLKEITKNADLLIVAIGKPHFLTAEMVKGGAIVIDVGINRLDDGKLVGDVDFNSVSKYTSYITPVPGGVGPMTIAMLLSNTLKAFKLQNSLN